MTVSRFFAPTTIMLLIGCAHLPSGSGHQSLALSDIENLPYGHLDRHELRSRFGTPDKIIPYAKENGEIWSYEDEDLDFGKRSARVNFWIESATEKVFSGTWIPRSTDTLFSIESIQKRYPNLRFNLEKEEVRGKDYIDTRYTYRSDDDRISADIGPTSLKNAFAISFSAPRNRALGSEAETSLKK